MEPAIFTQVLSPFIGQFVLGLAVNESSSLLARLRAARRGKEEEEAEWQRAAQVSARSLPDEVKAACLELADAGKLLALTSLEKPVWALLAQSSFHRLVTEWLMAGSLDEVEEARKGLVEAISGALREGGASEASLAYVAQDYMDRLERAVFASDVLDRWRRQLSLDWIRGQVQAQKELAERAAGIYPEEVRAAALQRYMKKALLACDIIDLSGLPEGDVPMATERLLLRRLYMPLRIRAEGQEEGEGLEGLEEKREALRLWEAGRGSTGNDGPAPRTVGDCMKASRRLVLLGDPGGGKTTLLRWMAAAFLLKRLDPAAHGAFPDVEALPEQSLVPILIRCRDLGEADLCRSFADFLKTAIDKSDLAREDSGPVQAVLLDLAAKGEALILVDGLDEIASPRVRAQFCEQVEMTAARYPEALIVATSRIVGYRDMPYRMRSGFLHGVIAGLERGDKDLFASRWIQATERCSEEEKEARRQDLVEALHSSDRIERLTASPMMLTTMVLVKRKVGKLPSRRHRLYEEAVKVLLNWNPRVYDPIDEEEALPQLEYLAFEMCERGVQRLKESDLLELLDRQRQEFPNLRALKENKPRDFLARLEARSGLLIQSGSVLDPSAAGDSRVWEFRHLTFQEYLAARALADGRHPGSSPREPLGSIAARLAGSVSRQGREVLVVESWSEALRLLPSLVRDSEVDEVIEGILGPVDEAEPGAARARTILAAQCLADEPPASEEVTAKVIQRLASLVDRHDYAYGSTSLWSAALGLSRAGRHREMTKALLGRCLPGEEAARTCMSLAGALEAVLWRRSGRQPEELVEEVQRRMAGEDPVEGILAALLVVALIGDGSPYAPSYAPSLAPIVNSLASIVRRGLDSSDRLLWLSSARALAALAVGPMGREAGSRWEPEEEELEDLLRQLSLVRLDASDEIAQSSELARRLKDRRFAPLLISWLKTPDWKARSQAARALGCLDDARALEPLCQLLEDQDSLVRRTSAEALGNLGDPRALSHLEARWTDQAWRKDQLDLFIALHQLGDPNLGQRLQPFLSTGGTPVDRWVVAAYASLRNQADQRLLTKDLDDLEPWIDPRSPITAARVHKASKALEITVEDVKARYEAMAGALGLTLEWKPRLS